MSDQTSGHTHDRSDEEPSTEELAEPSTEKEPGEEPKAPKPHDPAPTHHAVGIGIVDGPDPDSGAADDDSGAAGDDSVAAAEDGAASSDGAAAQGS